MMMVVVMTCCELDVYDDLQTFLLWQYARHAQSLVNNCTVQAATDTSNI